jgi:nicotinate-nucleotide adenylyltransferase
VTSLIPARALGFLPRRRVGLLGGSFNPAHDGHREIALAALARLGLDEVWLLVSPGNPLKPTRGMADLATRLDSARAIACRHPRLRVTAIEAALGTRYTVDTIAVLTRRFPRLRFVWLMGADNLVQISSWARWAEIFRSVPVAVMARPNYSGKALIGKAAQRFSTARISLRLGHRLASLTPPAWIFLHTRLNPVSASAIRRRRHALAIADNPAANAKEESIAPRKRKTPPTAVKALAKLIEDSLDDDKAEDIRRIDLTDKTSFADFMIVATGRNSRQLAAMADHLAEKLKARGISPVPIEGRAQGDWVLVDAGDIVVHLFRPEIREHYALEKMWQAEFADDAASAAGS